MNKIRISEFKKNLTVLILCGGKGLRLRPLTKDIPKPLIKIKNKSILENIIRYFLKFNVKNFIVATGYKHKMIENFIKEKFSDQNIKTLYTGLNSDIGERIKKSLKISKKNLLICYGDTMVDMNLNDYIKFFLSKSKKITVVSYQLESSFGIFKIKRNNQIVDFHEKPSLDIWFNVGYILTTFDKFFYFDKFKKFQDLIKYLSKKKMLKSFKHKGNHITVNTLSELEKAQKLTKKFIK